jgi:dihydrolipoamide dehydrogenase
MRIVIIGGGPAAYEAALVAAGHSQEVTLVSREGLGGNSVLWDCVPSKALIVSAQAMGWAQSAHRLGVRLAGEGEIAERSGVDMTSVQDRVRQLSLNQSSDITRKVERAGVELIRGEGRLLGPRMVRITTELGASTREADMILVATGSNPRVLEFFEPDGERVFTSRELFDLTDLPERLIVVGSGATGAEYAHAFARFGADVQLISSREQILPSEDSDAAAVIEDSFERWGMTIHRQKRAVDLELTSSGVRLRLQASKDGQAVEGDDAWVEGSHVLFCIGQVPASRELGLEEAGVGIADWGGVAVDGVSRTNVHTVYAAGDVTGGMMLASTAAMQGRNAVWHFLGKGVAPLRSDVVAKCIFTEPEVATVGITADQVQRAGTQIETVTLPLSGNPRAKMAEHTDGFVKIHARRGSGTVLGGAVVASGASDLVPSISVAVHNRLTVQQLAYAFTIYPSMAGSIQETARQLMARQPDEVIY